MPRRQSLCRYCWERGHTKRTCPEVKKVVAENPGSHLADSLKRRCSHCGSEEHTLAKCAAAIEEHRQRKIEFLFQREQWCNAISERGVMPGTLIKTQFYDKKDYTWKTNLGIVTEVQWNNFVNKYSSCTRVESLKDGNTTDVSAFGYYGETTIVSPMPVASCIAYNKSKMDQTNDKVLQEVVPKKIVKRRGR
jgi:hypothetical protein